MNKKLTIASVIFAASAVFAFDTWLGGDGNPQVDTGIGNTTETAGYWFAYNDKDDGGKSQVTWGGELGNEYSPDALDNVIITCGGVCGTAVLDKGTLTYQPFVGIGFNVVGETSENDKTPAAGDASAWGGVCITYTSDAAPALELGLGAFDQEIGYANPSASLPKSTAGTKKALAWSDFKQPSWYKGETKVTGAEAAAKLVAIKFKIQAAPGSYGFNICSVGPYDGTCPSACACAGPGCGGDAIKSVRGASAVKATLSGRVLNISGVKASATAEVINLQGQVVAKGDVSSALNLASLDAGVYMVRVAGKSVNFSNKIVLR